MTAAMASSVYRNTYGIQLPMDRENLIEACRRAGTPRADALADELARDASPKAYVEIWPAHIADDATPFERINATHPLGLWLVCTEVRDDVLIAVVALEVHRDTEQHTDAERVQIEEWLARRRTFQRLLNRGLGWTRRNEQTGKEEVYLMLYPVRNAGRRGG